MPKKSQLERLKEAARQLEADNDEVTINARLGNLVEQKPAPEARKKDD